MKRKVGNESAEMLKRLGCVILTMSVILFCCVIEGILWFFVLFFKGIVKKCFLLFITQVSKLKYLLVYDKKSDRRFFLRHQHIIMKVFIIILFTLNYCGLNGITIISDLTFETKQNCVKMVLEFPLSVLPATILLNPLTHLYTRLYIYCKVVI